MEMISEELVEETWQEMGSLMPALARREMTKVSRSQPNLLAFLMEFTEELDQDAKELGVYMFYVLCRMFQKRAKKRIKRISTKEVIDCYEKNLAFLENLEGAHERFFERIAETQLSAQPHVMKYVVETLMEAPEEETDPIHLSDDDIGYLFLLLKTVIDLLDQKV